MTTTSVARRISKEVRSQYACFVGVDLHKTTVTMQAVDPEQKVIAGLTISTKCIEKIEFFLRQLPQPAWVAVEAVGFVEWFIDAFRGLVARMDIADATELAGLRGKRRKTDPNDALDIAIRLAEGTCPLGFIADDQLMDLRKMGRHWRRLSRTLGRAKQCMRSLLDAANLPGPKLDGASAHKWLLANGSRLKEVNRRAFADLLDIVQLTERLRESLRVRIFFANREERFAQDIRLLQSVPGIKEVWSCIIAGEVGPFERFPHTDALEFWSGLTPDNATSAGRTQSGNISKAGSVTLRWALGKAALSLCRSDPGQEAVRQRLIRRIGKAKANVAMARKLLRILYAMMTKKTPYETRPQDVLRRALRRQVRNGRKERRQQRDPARACERSGACFAPRPQPGARAEGAKNAPGNPVQQESETMDRRRNHSDALPAAKECGWGVPSCR